MPPCGCRRYPSCAILDDARRIAPTIITSTYGRPLDRSWFAEGISHSYPAVAAGSEDRAWPDPTWPPPYTWRRTGKPRCRPPNDPSRSRPSKYGRLAHYSAGADRRRAASAVIELLEKPPRKGTKAARFWQKFSVLPKGRWDHRQKLRNINAEEYRSRWGARASNPLEGARRPR